MRDPALLDEAVKRNDPARVRDLLKDATEGGRRACAKAMRLLLTGPEQAPTAIAARANDHGMPPWPSPPAGQNT